MHGQLHPILPSNTAPPTLAEEVLYAESGKNANRSSQRAEVEDVRYVGGT